MVKVDPSCRYLSGTFSGVCMWHDSECHDKCTKDENAINGYCSVDNYMCICESCESSLFSQ